MERSRCDEVRNDVLSLLQPAKSGDVEHWRDWPELVGVARIVTKAELSDSQATVNLFAAIQMIVMKTMLKVLFDESPYLTDDELVEGRTTTTQFWTSPHRMIIDHLDVVAQWHSVVRAGVATPEIFDLVLDAGADITAWCEPTNDSLPEEEEELLPSQLCVSTPVHAAIASEDHAMLPKLFESGISPNARALMAGNQALTPAQYAIMLGDLETCTLLRDHGADSPITTPVLNTHALHFAAAHLRIDPTEATRQDLSGAAAPVANTGHTLLHIACLPFDRGHIQTSSGKISQSIHDIRYMSPVSRRASRTIPTYNESGEENLFLGNL